MEHLEVFDCSNVFIASFFTDDRGCAHCNSEHTLIYIYRFGRTGDNGAQQKNCFGKAD